MIKKNLKIRAFLSVTALVTCILVGGCGNDTSDRNVVIGSNNSTSASDEIDDSDENYAFVYNNVKITPNDLVEPLITALGSDYTYLESPSCAYIGLDKCYVYKNPPITHDPLCREADYIVPK